MDHLFLRRLNAIARDHTSGAAELALSATDALQSWIRRHPHPAQQQLLEIARALVEAQPAMATFLRLANVVALAADGDHPPGTWTHAVRQMHAVLHTAPTRIARRFASALRRRRHWNILTYSYSSTVVAALCRTRFRVGRVCCSEGRPAFEGRKTAERLAAAGIRVAFQTDAALFRRVEDHDLVVLGADQIGERSFVNKVGTQTVVARAVRAGKQVWVLSDTTKFLPAKLGLATCQFSAETLAGSAELPKLEFRIRPSGGAHRGGPLEEVWQDAPKGVMISNDYFEPTHYSPGLRVLTEQGWMTPAQVRHACREIQVSPFMVSLEPRWKARRVRLG